MCDFEYKKQDSSINSKSFRINSLRITSDSKYIIFGISDEYIEIALLMNEKKVKLICFNNKTMPIEQNQEYQIKFNLENIIYLKKWNKIERNWKKYLNYSAQHLLSKESTRVQKETFN